MNRKNFDGEMIQCPKCGKEYASFYEECPFCEAERTSRAVQKYGRKQSAGQRMAAIVLAVLLVLGGGYLVMSLVTSGQVAFGREYAVVTKTPEAMQMGVTKQEVALSTQTPEESVTPEADTAGDTLQDGDTDDQDDTDEDEDDDSAAWTEGD
jgi:hypothetical protein